MEPVSVQRVRFEVDGVMLDGDRLTPAQPRGAAVVCHPHPLYGGSRHDAVVGTVCRTLVGADWDVLRFDFRGAGDSEGTHSGGPGERDDLQAAIELMATGEQPLIVAGYSFGADVALSVADDRIDRWIAVAPVLAIFTAFAASADPRPKTLIAADHDQFMPSAKLATETADWSATDVRPVPGTDHFFHGAQRSIEAAVTDVVA